MTKQCPTDKYYNFKHVYSRPAHGDIPACEVYECESEEYGEQYEYFNNIVKSLSSQNDSADV